MNLLILVVALLCCVSVSTSLPTTCVGLPTSSTCMYFPDKCASKSKSEDAAAVCEQAITGGRLCTREELQENVDTLRGRDGCRRSTWKRFFWTSSTCTRRRRRRNDLEGTIAFRGRRKTSRCVTRRNAQRFVACCKDMTPEPPEPKPIPAQDCNKIDNMLECQVQPNCEFIFENAANGQPYGCQAKHSFCGFVNQQQCESWCSIRRCAWSSFQRKCILREDFVPPETPESPCTATQDKGICATQPTCEWVEENVGEKTFRYGCKPKGNFCGFDKGTSNEIQAQCNNHASSCVFDCNRCSPKARGVLEGRSKPPNIILSVADDLGWDDIGFNNPKIHTPTLNQLAQDGIKLNAHYTSRFCSPSRSMLLSGNMPWRHGQHSDINMNPYDSLRCGLQESLQTLPQVLHSVGYKTHIVGKWHLGHYRPKFWPTNRGFDTFVGYFGGVQGVDVPEEDLKIFKSTKCSCRGNSLRSCGWNGLTNCAYASQLFNATKDALEIVPDTVFESYDYADLFLADEAVRLIRQHDKSSPLFLYTAFDSPHDPHRAPQRFRNLNADTIGQETCAQRTRLELAGMVSALDEAHSRMLQALQDTGLWEDTLFVFLSDNGGYNEGEGREACPSSYKRSIASSNYPLRGSKFTFWEGGIRAVSFISGGSGLIPRGSKGKVFDGLFSATDWFRTLLSAAEVRWDAGFENQAQDSIDQWQALKTLQSRADSPRQEIAVQIWKQVNRHVIIKNIDGNTFKYLYGYPGYLTGMDWIRPQKPARRKSDWDKIHIPIERDLEEVPSSIRSAPTFDCVRTPCLFNLSEDPSETTNLHAIEQDIVGKMQSAIVPYLSQELSLDQSGLCVVNGPHILLDGKAIAQARKCGAFAPWLESTTEDALTCPPFMPMTLQELLDVARNL